MTESGSLRSRSLSRICERLARLPVDAVARLWLDGESQSPVDRDSFVEDADRGERLLDTRLCRSLRLLTN